MANPRRRLTKKIFENGKPLADKIVELELISDTNLFEEVSKYLKLADDGGMTVVGRGGPNDIFNILYDLNIRVDTKSRKYLHNRRDRLMYVAQYSENWFITISVTKYVNEYMKEMFAAYNISLDGFEIKQ